MLFLTCCTPELNFKVPRILLQCHIDVIMVVSDNWVTDFVLLRQESTLKWKILKNLRRLPFFFGCLILPKIINKVFPTSICLLQGFIFPFHMSVFLLSNFFSLCSMYIIFILKISI